MKELFFNVVSGASGDMILASLVDLGVPVDHLQEQLSRLHIHGLSVGAEKTVRGGITCSHMRLKWEEEHEHHHHRHLEDLVAMLKSGGFAQRVIDRGTEVLTRLGAAEARIHGVPLDQVHFHEIGAVDTIIDIAGVCICLEYLQAGAVWFSTLTEGHGTVTAAHGTMPIPCPATTLLIEGLQLQTVDVASELLTPTGAALLTTLGSQRQCMPAGAILKSGYGCGDKSFGNVPNILRAVLVETAGPAASPDDERVCVIETDIDHISGEILAYAADRCFDAGALDVSWTPVFMKKGRPAYRMTALCREEDRERVADTVMAETRTLGVRFHTVSRQVAQRTAGETVLLDTQVREKRCSYKGRAFTKIEFDDLAALARRTGRPLPEIAEEYLRRTS